jgi:hypothetical protein
MSDQDKKKPASPTSDAGLTLPNPKQEETSRGTELATTPDNEAAITFLQELYPDGPWLLTAIVPDGGRPFTETFGPERIDAAMAFLAEHNGRHNLYYSVAAPSGALRKKASKADIAYTRYLHVDLDPRAGENDAEERDRLRALLTEKLPSEVPPPTTIVFSGGGLQALWRLAEPVTINGDVAACANLERYNRGLEFALGGDHCHDVSRILRLPGTTNIPDARKRAKGRQPAVATLVAHHPERVYGLHEFPQSEDPAEAAALASKPAPALPSAIAGLADLDRWAVPDRVKAIIMHGHHPGEAKTGDSSRSGWLFDATCQLVRAGVPDETILGILTDRQFAISASVLDYKEKALAYARRQIDRARQATHDPELARMNERHAVLLQEGGKTRVLSWERSEIDPDRQIPVLQSFQDFRNRYMNRQVVIGADPTSGAPMKMQAGKWWLAHPDRRQYLALRFMPGQPEEVDDYLNLWCGFSVSPAPGDWSLMQNHIREVLANGDAASASYITRWAAWAVQKPEAAAEVALVMKGGRGTGKGFFARALKQLFGQHGLHVYSPSHLTGRFNAHLRDCCLLFADEAIAPGDKIAESILKGLVTEPELPIEGKGVNVVQARNRLHIVMTSNEQWVVPAGHDERRFAVFEVSGAKAQAHNHFAKMAAELENGGLAAMLHDLLAMDLAGWHPRRDVPQTAALRAQKDLSLSAEDQFVLGVLEEGAIPGAKPYRQPRTRFSNDHHSEPGLYTAMRRASPRLRDYSDQRLSDVLKRWGCTKWSSGAARGWTFPPLAEMRAAWDQRHQPRSWTEPSAWLEAEEARKADEPF